LTNGPLIILMFLLTNYIVTASVEKVKQ